MPNETMVFQWGRIQTPADWILPILGLVVCLWLVWRLYRRDSQELGTFWKLLLPTLRTGVMLLLLILYLQPQWRMEREVQQNSQVAIFLDTSLSMGLTNEDSPESRDISRADAMVQLLEATPLLQELNRKHDLTFITVDTNAQRVALWTKHTEGRASTAPDQPEVKEKEEKEGGEKETETPVRTWKEILLPKGAQTRLSDAMGEWLQANAQSPVAGLVLLSDGAQNAGSDGQRTIDLAKKAEIPIYTIGFGSAKPVENIRIYEVEAPSRVQPHDPFSVTALIQGHGLSKTEPKVVRVELVSRPQTAEQANPGAAPAVETLLGTVEVVLGGDGKVEPAKFQISPQPEGKYLYTLRVPAGDQEQLLQDNQREFELEVVDRQTKSLVLAGGPTREYQFLLTTLFRDKTMLTDVLLQSAKPGIAQEANKILDAFPASREELFAYDCLVAVDPNWKQLTTPQVEMLDEWLAYQGGGVILVAGPVFMGETVGGWLEDPNLSSIRAIYPVEFQKRFSTSRQSTYAAEQPWTLDFTREGLEADFLRLADTSAENLAVWSAFPGVYGYFPTKRVKSGATALAFFSNPQTRQGDEAPALIVSQFYGSGRVLYLGTGEFWRLRSENPDYFVRFYTQLIRYVAKGRMMQQSTRGRLMLTKEQFFPGDLIEIRATLLDPQMQPLAVKELTADVFLPNGKVQGVKLQLDAEHPGQYHGSFSTLLEGTVRIELPIPDSEERLTRRAELVLSDLERENPQRNTALLTTLKSSGTAHAP